MNIQEKQLLIQDLCTRLSYGVCVAKGNIIYPMTGVNIALGYVELAVSERISIEEARPYLRPMSSMTEEEYECFVDVLKRGMICRKCYDWHEQWIQSPSVEEWLNAHHFDYRGLIPMGLALPALEGMYDFK